MHKRLSRALQAGRGNRRRWEILLGGGSGQTFPVCGQTDLSLVLADRRLGGVLTDVSEGEWGERTLRVTTTTQGDEARTLKTFLQRQDGSQDRARDVTTKVVTKTTRPSFVKKSAQQKGGGHTVRDEPDTLFECRPFLRRASVLLDHEL
jgi:hypothetical protein